MGKELQYQGLPPNSGLVELVRELAQTRAEEAQRVQFVPGILRGDPHLRDGRGPISDWCRDALIRFPGIQDRNLNLDRAFDKLHYLLSEERRADNWDGQFRDRFDLIISQAFGWAEVIADNLVATQGTPIYMIGPEGVREIGASVATISRSDVAANFDATRMDNLAIYKAYYIGRSDEELRGETEFLCDVFEQFKAFFVQAAEANESVVYWID